MPDGTQRQRNINLLEGLKTIVSLLLHLSQLLQAGLDMVIVHLEPFKTRINVNRG